MLVPTFGTIDQLSAVTDGRGSLWSFCNIGINRSASKSKSSSSSAIVARKTIVSLSAISTRIPNLINSFSIVTPLVPSWLARITIFVGSKRPAAKSDVYKKIGRSKCDCTRDLKLFTLCKSCAINSSPRRESSARTPSIEASGAPAGDVVCVVSKLCSTLARFIYFPWTSSSADALYPGNALWTLVTKTSAPSCKQFFGNSLLNPKWPPHAASITTGTDWAWAASMTGSRSDSVPK